MASASPPAAFLIARSILSLGMDSALALAMARRRRALALGSGTPALAAMVMSRDSLEKSLDRSLSWRPLRNWMFLNLEWPAMGVREVSVEVAGLLANPASESQFALCAPVSPAALRGNHAGLRRGRGASQPTGC